MPANGVANKVLSPRIVARKTTSTPPVQPHPWVLAVGELHPRFLQGFPDSCQGLRLPVRFATLDCVNGIEVNFGLLAKVPYAPIQKASCRSYLCACHRICL